MPAARKPQSRQGSRSEQCAILERLRDRYAPTLLALIALAVKLEWIPVPVWTMPTPPCGATHEDLNTLLPSNFKLEASGHVPYSLEVDVLPTRSAYYIDDSLDVAVAASSSRR